MNSLANTGIWLAGFAFFMLVLVQSPMYWLPAYRNRTKAIRLANLDKQVLIAKAKRSKRKLKKTKRACNLYRDKLITLGIDPDLLLEAVRLEKKLENPLADVGINQ